MGAGNVRYRRDPILRHRSVAVKLVRATRKWGDGGAEAKDQVELSSESKSVWRKMSGGPLTTEDAYRDEARA